VSVTDSAVEMKFPNSPDPTLRNLRCRCGSDDLAALRPGVEPLRALGGIV